MCVLGYVAPMAKRQAIECRRITGITDVMKFEGFAGATALALELCAP
jgi:hypothetical protein